MKTLICFCAPLAIFYVVHQIQYPTIIWRSLTLREGDTKKEMLGLATCAWLELLSFGITISYVVSKLS